MEISLLETINFVSFMMNLLEYLVIHSCFCNNFISYFDKVREETHIAEQNRICL